MLPMWRDGALCRSLSKPAEDRLLGLWERRSAPLRVPTVHPKKLDLGRSAEGSHPNLRKQIPLIEPTKEVVIAIESVDRPQGVVFEEEMIFPGPECEVASIGEVGLTPVVHTRTDGRPELEVAVNGVKVCGLLDSGATVSVMSERLWRAAGKGPLIPDNGNLKAANGSPLVVLGRTDIELGLGKVKVPLSTLVVSNSAHSLILGMDFWRAGRLEITGPVCTQVAGVNRAEVQIEAPLLAEDQRRLMAVLDGFLVAGDDSLTRTAVLEHDIELMPDAKPFLLRTHHYSPALEARMVKELDRMLALGVIGPSKSPVASPIVPVVKKNGDVRLCLDSRHLNSITRRDQFPVPNLSAMLGRMQSYEFYVSLDLKSAFWQVPLAERRRPGQWASARELTAFVFPGRGLYHFNVMPFGLCNSPATQCRLMHQVLGHDLEPRVMVYLDDVLIMGNSVKEVLGLLAEVGKRLREANLSVHLGKCKFFFQVIRFCGFIIGKRMVRADPEKIRVMQEYPVPRSVREVRQFLGLVGYYRRLIPDFSGVTTPLSDLLKKIAGPLNWTDGAQDAFERLKMIMVSEPVVQNPDFSVEFQLQCDASDVSGAAVLGQIQGGQEVVIAYWSHKWTGAERNWAATEKEAGCVLLSIRHFRAYLFGAHFTVITDAQALMHLRTMRVDKSGRLARWALEMREYDVTIKHRAGKLSVVPDALSRVVAAIEPLEREEDPWLAEMINKIASNPQHFADFRLEGQRLLKLETVEQDVGGYAYRWKEYVPALARRELIQQSHRELHHPGWERCYESLRRQFFWPQMAREVESHIRPCDTCLAAKRRYRNTRVPLGESRIADSPFQLIAIDHMGALPRSRKGNTHVLVVVDVLTKYVLIHPCKNAKARPVVQFIEEEVFLKYGVPQSLLSDNAKAFLGREMIDLLNKYGVDHLTIPVHHPQANIAERYVQTVGVAIRCWVVDQDDDQREWDARVPMIQAAINSLPSFATGISPFKLNFGRDMILSGAEYSQLIGPRPRPLMAQEVLEREFEELRESAKRHLVLAQTRSRALYDRNTRPLTFEVGEKVWRRNRQLAVAREHFTPKLAKRFVAARVVQIMGSDTYMLQDLDVPVGPAVKYHANDLYKDVVVAANAEAETPENSGPPASPDGSPFFGFPVSPNAREGASPGSPFLGFPDSPGADLNSNNGITLVEGDFHGC